MLLSRHGQVSLLELLPVYGILEQGEVVECLLFVQIGPPFSKLRGESPQDIVDPIGPDNIKDSVQGALRVLTLADIVLDEVDEVSDHFLLVVNEFIIDFSFETLGFELLLAVFSLLQRNLVHVDFVNLDGVLAPLTSQVLLVHGQKTSIFGNLDLDFCVLFTVDMEKIQGRVQDRDTLLVPIHILFVGA